MKSAVDTSILVAALDGGDPDHASCRQLLLSGKFFVHSHALSETFATLTGGRLAFRISAQDAAGILRHQLAPKLTLIPFGEQDLLAAYDAATSRGIRGGAIYDYLHLAAAKKASVANFFTLNTKDFVAFHRSGDPEILHP